MNSMANRVEKVAPSAPWVDCHDPCGCNQAPHLGQHVSHRRHDLLRGVQAAQQVHGIPVKKGNEQGSVDEQK